MLNEYFTNTERYGKFHRFLNADNRDTIKYLYNNYANLTAADIEQCQCQTVEMPQPIQDKLVQLKKEN